MKKYTIVLLHGWGQNHQSMMCFEEELKKEFIVKNINLLKLSKKSVFDFDDYINDLHRVLKDDDNLVLIGHSFGGKIASLYATKYKVEKLILIAPSTYIKKSFKTKVKILLHKIIKFFKIKRLMHLFKSNDYKKLNEIEQQTFKNIVKNIAASDLKSLNIPTLIIGFKDDKQVSFKSLKILYKTLPDSYLISYLGDHFAYIEHSEEILLNIMDFIYD